MPDLTLQLLGPPTETPRPSSSASLVSTKPFDLADQPTNLPDQFGRTQPL